MAIFAIFLGGFVGFIAAVISMIGYDASLLSAIGVYFTIGMTFATGAILNAVIQPLAPAKAPVKA